MSGSDHNLLKKMQSMLSVLSLLSVVSVATAYTPAALADQITNLPGAEKLALSFNQFSGYLDIPGTTGALTKHMHYW